MEIDIKFWLIFVVLIVGEVILLFNFGHIALEVYGPNLGAFVLMGSIFLYTMLTVLLYMFFDGGKNL